MKNKILAIGIIVLMLLVVLSSGCTDDGGSDKKDSVKTGKIEVIFHVEEDSTTDFELYVDNMLVSEKSQLVLGPYKWGRSNAKTGPYSITLTYYWDDEDDWLGGGGSDTLEETFTLNAGQTKTINWCDEESVVTYEPEYEEDEYEDDEELEEIPEEDEDEEYEYDEDPEEDEYEEVPEEDEYEEEEDTIF